ncbi:hypothetical protein [Sphingomicrobium arenosum]|uniref:hypothetical protein n=1 Tax=Sphingomicrobium arenosum TaxID=2233861 RepID=UPI00223F94AF|nr:hypothetical protein [Sphingomicrobium arenosum]
MTGLCSLEGLDIALGAVALVVLGLALGRAVAGHSALRVAASLIGALLLCMLLLAALMPNSGECGSSPDGVVTFLLLPLLGMGATIAIWLQSKRAA